MIRAAVVALITLSPPALADTKMCVSYGEMAAAIMGVRQQGTAMSTLMGLVVEGASEADYALMHLMVIEAYKVPQYRTDDSRQREVDVFTNDMLLICYDR